MKLQLEIQLIICCFVCEIIIACVFILGLAKYFVYCREDFNDTLKKYSLSVHLQFSNVWK